MIPAFPTFKKLELEDQRAINALVSSFPPYSDFNFASLYAYNINNAFTVSRVGTNLLINMEDYMTGEPLYSVLGNDDIMFTFSLLAHELDKYGNKSPLLKLVPEATLKSQRRILSRDFIIEPDPDNFDYVISATQLAKLSGRKYSTKRQKINQFKKSSPHHRIEVIDITKTKIQHEILDLFLDWTNSKAVSERDSAREYNALTRYFEIRKLITGVDIGVFIDNKLIAFTLNEIVHGGYYIGHFGKADYSIPGSFQFIEQATAKVMHKKKCKYMNFEQDLGIEGLKESKLSWHPIRFLKKYNIYCK